MEERPLQGRVLNIQDDAFRLGGIPDAGLKAGSSTVGAGGVFAPRYAQAGWSGVPGLIATLGG